MPAITAENLWGLDEKPHRFRTVKRGVSDDVSGEADNADDGGGQPVLQGGKSSSGRFF